MIVVDASVIVAINIGEPGFETYALALTRADKIIASPVNLVEAGMVIASRLNAPDTRAFEEWLLAWRIETADQVDWNGALTALMTFGKGRHPARLNLGDCFAYALAKSLDAPLLYKGDGFAKTDIRSALQPT